MRARGWSMLVLSGVVGVASVLGATCAVGLRDVSVPDTSAPPAARVAADQVEKRVGAVAAPADVLLSSRRPGGTRAAGRSRHVAPTVEEVGRAALRALPYDLSRTGFRVEFLPGRDGMLGETFLDERIIRMYIRRSSRVPDVTRVLAHEVGHAVDVAFMTDRSRQRWLALRGASGTPWWPHQGHSDFGTGAGDFAEVFARWTLGEQAGSFRSTVAPAPSPSALQELAVFFQG